MNDLNFDGCPFPFTTASLHRFERQNPTLAICLLKWIEKKNGVNLIRPALPTCPNRRVIHILWVQGDGDNAHYVGVTNLERLLNTKADFFTQLS